MTRIFATLLLTIPTYWTMGQKLLVENQKGKKKRIQIGSIMTVTTFSDSTNSDPFHYNDPVNMKTSYWCLTGCYKLVAIDTTSGIIKIQRSDSLVLDYKTIDVKSINYVKSRHPDRIRARRITFATFGSLVLFSGSIAVLTADSDSQTDIIIMPALGAAMIGYSLLDKRNESRRYKLLRLTD